ncbi:MAG TPA: BatD family protein [Myxococcota bacterium]|nr:BatD family protein [Myxococcota bacterium]HRY94297.1 BatD family protein [Myxococcota bacterium]
MSARVLACALLGLLGLLARPARAGEVEFTAAVNSRVVPVDRPFRLTISVAVPDVTKIGFLELPETGSLEVLGTSREESLAFSFGGAGSQYQKFQNTRVTLRPRKQGKVTIGAATLKYDGKLYKTEPIEITVTAARRGGRSGQVSPVPGLPPSFPSIDDWLTRDPTEDLYQAQEIGEDDIFARLEVAPDRAVEGQQITATLLIYSRVGARIAEYRWPKLEDFFTLDRDVSNAKVDEKYIDGERFQYKILDRKALFPLRPGEYTLGAVAVEVEAGNSPFFAAERRTLRTRPVRVKVEPLPAEGRPDDFEAGNVGRYTLSAEVDSAKVGLNQPVTYTLTIRGVGNIQRLRAPELKGLPGFKIFEPTVDLQQPKQGRLAQGSKTFEYVLLPLAAGRLTIPDLPFSFYDPEAGGYRTLHTGEKVIEVVAGGDGAALAAGQPPGREVNLLSDSFKPVRFESALGGYGPPFYRSDWFLPLLALPPGLWLLLLAAAAVRAGLSSQSPRSRARRMAADARRRWRQAARLLAAGQAADFYAELKDALLLAAEARVGAPVHGLPLPEVQARLGQALVPDAIVEALVREVENCDFGRFAPAVSRGDEMSAAHARAQGLMRSLATARVAPPAPRRRRP